MRQAPKLLLLTLFLAVGAAPIAAQVGSSVDVITGTVTDSLGKAVPNAAVEAYSIETQVVRKTTTNGDGRYTIFFNDGGGQYRLTVTMIGMRPFVANITRQSDDDRIMVDVRMSSRPVVLQDLTISGQRNRQGGQGERPTPGSTEQVFSGEQALRLPVDASDLAALAALVPGVIVTAGTDSTAAQFSIAGQAGTANNYTVDGLSFGGDALPQDAIRSTRVITNTYDVARGQFSGGLISAQTQRGGNVVRGSMSGNLRDDAFSLGGSGDAFNQGRSSQRLGFGFGGPIVRDKLFAFGSFQLDRSQSLIASLADASVINQGRLGLSSDSVARFTSLISATGLTAAAGPIGPGSGNDRYTGMLRADWNIADRHTVSFRGDLRLNDGGPSRIGSTQLPQVGGTSDGNGGGVSVGIFSRVGVALTNELRAGFTTDHSSSDPYLVAPSGRVQNVSALDDGRLAYTVLGFGGNSGLPQESTNKGFELTEELSLYSPSAAHRYRLGFLYNTQTADQDVTRNRYGTYSYNSLADLAANQPAQFTRTLTPTIRGGRTNNSAIYLSDAWRPTSNLQLTYGGRLERSWFGGAPERNTAAEERFGVHTDVLPSETYFTPRAGFSWSIASAEQRGQSQRGFAPPKLVISGGAGLFRGTMPTSIPGTAQAQSGLLDTESQLICVGDAVPIPDWSEYASSAAAIPTSCNGPATPANLGVPNITTYASDYGAAKTWRASLGLRKRIWDTWSLSLDGSYVRGIDQSASRDLNLVTTPRFTLGGEDGRPVYALPDEIIPGTGAIPLSASRIDPAYGMVNEVFSGLENRTVQLTASISAFLRRGASLRFSYTWMNSRDQGGSGGGGGGFGGRRGGIGGGFTAAGSNATAGDPNEFAWANSSRTHNFQAMMSWTFSQALDASLVGRLTSGSRYTPIVAGDINGDGSSRNDIAYIYNPATTSDPEVAAGMANLLSGLNGNARSCIASQLGGIADRNSCIGPWQASLDMQVNWRPGGIFANRMALSVSTVNLLGGLDQLFHGSDDLHGWGLTQRPDATLLQVTGFDPDKEQFRYNVNERFGATGGQANAIRSPFQLALQMRYSIGQDRMREMRQRFFSGAGQMSLVEQMVGRLDSLTPNPAKEALIRRDSLALDQRQIAALQLLVDSSEARLRPPLDSLEAVIKAGGSNPDIQKILPLFNEVRRVTALDHDSTTARTRQILTDAQWALLPEWVRNPTQANPFFGRGGQGRPGGRRGGGRP